MSQEFGAVLFDFDGVIVNSEPLHYRAFRQVLAEDRIELSEEEYFSEMIGLDDRGSFKHLFQKRGIELTPKDLLHILARKGQAMLQQIHTNAYQALPGVEALVRGLWRVYPLAICSASVREEIEIMLEGVSLRDCFAEIISAEDVTVGKPDPQGYVLAMQRLSERFRKPLHPRDCLIIEDAPRVVTTTKKLGFRTLGVTTSHFADKFADADWITRTLDPDEVVGKIPGLKMVR